MFKNFEVIVFLLSLCPQTIPKIIMKRYKVKEVIKLLEDDHWYLDYCKGSHKQFRHPIKQTKVTIRGKQSDDLSQEILNSIWKQAGWK